MRENASGLTITSESTNARTSELVRATPAFRAAAAPPPGGRSTTMISSGGSTAARIASTQRSRVGGPSVAGTITARLGARCGVDSFASMLSARRYGLRWAICSYLSAMSKMSAPPTSEGRSDGATAPGRAKRCDWCGAAFGDGAARPAGRIECGHCGAATTDPVPTDDELDAAYAGWYRPAAGRFAGPADRLLRHTRSRLAVRLDRIAPAGAILDVGTGDGALLDALRRRGRSAFGLEREASRTDVRTDDIADVDGQWAAVVFWHSLEHLRAARAALQHSCRLLLPGGVVVIAMPNYDSLQARVFGDRWLGLDLPRHLVHVPEPALTEALSEAGLRVERKSHLRGGQAVFGWLQGLVRSLPGRVDLYDAIRRPEARRRPLTEARRRGAIAAAAVLLPVAMACAAVEAALGRGGIVYVEARRV